MKGSFFGTLPIIGSDIALQWDRLYIFLVLLSLAFFVLVVGGMIVFAFAYRHHNKPKPKYIEGSHILEAIFLGIPTVLLALIFGWGYWLYNNMVTPPSNAYEVKVLGKQWTWQFFYEDGKTTTNEVFVPLNKPVRFVMTSQDVLHSFFIPNMRIKNDVVPGRYTSIWFEPRVPGVHQVYCAEYCGGDHSRMLAKVVVLDEAQWQEFKAGKKIAFSEKAGSGERVALSAALSDEIETVSSKQAPAIQLESLAVHGKKVFEAKGCASCHSTDGTSGKLGPTVKAVFGSHVALQDGSNVLADENYIRESIENPAAKLVRGYNPMMPTFKGLIDEPQMTALLAYLKSLNPALNSGTETASQPTRKLGAKP